MFEGVPRFSPEHFARLRVKDPMKRKQFITGLDQLVEEGTVQAFTVKGNEKDPILGVVGALQLDVLAERLQAEYGLPVSFEHSRFKICRWISADDPLDLDKFQRAFPASIAEDLDHAPVYLAQSAWSLRYAQEKWPQIHFNDVKDYQKKAQ